MEKTTKTEKCGECIHIYNFLENQEMENKLTAWVFYCKKCLDIRLVTKSTSLEQVD
ncbi:MAG: hypothetical protein KKF44_04390 [Nanoarchaeota archaeon]|nr:hypothetical protein [Nanoarchaeota archaeon]